MANEFIARKGLIVLANGAKVTGSLGVQGDIDATGYNVTASNLQLLGSASIAGDLTLGGNLTVGNADIDVVKFLAEVSSSILPDVNNAFDFGSAAKNWRDLHVSGTSYLNTIEATSATGSFTGSFTGNVNATTFSFDIDGFGSDLTGITVSGTDKLLLSDGGTDGRINVQQLATPLAGTGLEVNSNKIALDTSSAHFLSGVKQKLNTDGIFSSSVQTDVRQTTGIATIATTGSNTFTSNQIVSGNISLGSDGQIRIPSTINSTLFGFYDGSNILGAYYQMWGNNHASTTQRGSAEFVFDTRNSGGGFRIAGFDGSTFTSRLEVSRDGVTSITGSLNVTGGITGSILSTNGVVSSSAQVTSLLPTGTVSSSVQVDVRNTTGIETIATTGSNTFTGIQNISNTTNSTAFNNGALIVQGGVGIAKDVNISGSLNVTGLLTAVSMSTQYVTSSQYVVGVSRIVLNDDDTVRFAGISIEDSGSSYTTASILWDSLNHHFVYDTISGSSYESAWFIAGPQNTGSLGDEVGLITGRIPVASGDNNIDTNPSLTPLRVVGTTLHAEGNVYVTGSVTASAFAGDGSNITGIVTNLNLTGSEGGTGTVSLKTQALTIDGTNGIAATVSGQTITISGSNATTTAKGVASFTSSNFTVTGGEVSANPITFNSVPLNLGSSYSFGIQNITSQGATTADQLVLNGGAVIHGVLYSSGSNTDVDTGTEVVATVQTGSYDAAFFDYVVKKGSNYRAGTVMAVWEAGTTNVEFTDTSTNDLGNTADITFTVDILTATARLKATAVSNDWYIKTAVRAL